MIEDMYDIEDHDLLAHCTLCPRACGINRFEGGTGYCGMDAGLNIASVCIHRGEEPPISGRDGICNIFFSGCNLRCIFCQNHEISRPGNVYKRNPVTFPDAIDQVESILSTGIKAVGFVSPSHVVPQVKAIIRELNARGHKPVTVYNTNGYDKPDTIESLQGLVDIYLPDYKYISPELSKRYSDAYDYPDVVLKALKKMYFQKGSTLPADSEGRAESGILIRHLVLPGHVEESENVLVSIADELSTGVHISLMSQYHPVSLVSSYPALNRSLYKSEYEAIVKKMESLGFRNGWIQDMNSYKNYQPDFGRKHPFEHNGH